MAKTAVITVSWNCLRDVEKCLSSLEKHAPRDVEIILVDNDSEDDTVSEISKKFPNVHILAQKDNLGFGKANNLGALQTNAEYLFILNPDTRILPGAIEKLTEFLDTTKEAGLAVPQIYDNDNIYTNTVYKFPTIISYWLNHSIISVILERLKKGKNRKRTWPDIREIDWAMGSALMIRRKALNGQPVFDEKYFMYCEDTDLCKRLKEMGWKIYQIPGSKIIHSHRGSSKKAKARTIFHLFHSMDIYYSCHKGRISRFLLRVSITLDMLIRIMIINIFLRKDFVQKDNIERLKGYKKVLKKLNPFTIFYQE
jgi:N-acetylglucosaminyl-diphospho-decaprenol L-rhamnosyltransferase